MKETELAQKFTEYLSCYDLYFEVDYAGHSIDIVALAEKITISYEVKTSFNFKVFEQALQNKPYFNYSYIAVPEFNDRSFQIRLCKDYGIGLLTYDSKRGFNDIRELVQPQLNRHSNNKYLIKRLHEYNKRSIPGAKSGDSNRITAFQVTVENMVTYVQRHPGCTIKEMISEVSHHYRNDKAAINNTYQWIHKGIIKELRLEKKCLFINSFEKTESA
jgi:hypothetical protein